MPHCGASSRSSLRCIQFRKYLNLEGIVQVLSGMIKQLEAHKKDLTSDAAEMMEVCETLEFDNRRMSRESLVSLFSRAVFLR